MFGRFGGELFSGSLNSDSSKEANTTPQYYPLVMDAPFSNVDEIHIKNISAILSRSAEQVIIAVMQKDWEPAAEIMAPLVGRSYRIEKDHDAEGKEIDTMTHIKGWLSPSLYCFLIMLLNYPYQAKIPLRPS